jgi:hypothetical protein
VFSKSNVILVVHDGRNTMPAFDVFTEQQLVNISSFVAVKMSNKHKTVFTVSFRICRR